MSGRLDHMVRQHREAVDAVEKTERIYRAVHRGYAEKYPHEPDVAERKASDDVRARAAVADGAWQRERAVMYGIAALVEIWSEGLT